MNKSEIRSLMGEIEQLLQQNDYAEAERAIKRFASECYKEGYCDAVTNYAVCRDGEQLVGVMARPLKTVLEEVAQAEVPIRY